MNLQILNYWQKVNLVLIKSTFLILLTIFSCSNTNIKRSYTINNIYYDAINNIISKDTITPVMIKSFDNYIITGKYTKKQIDSFISHKKQNMGLVFLHQKNKSITSVIKENLKTKGELHEYYGKSKLKKLLSSIPHEKILDVNFLKTNHRISKVGNHYGHQFSSPIIINNEMIIHHINFKGKYNMTSEILIFDIIKPKKIKLKKKLYLTIS